jgi:F-type H+-transporting ATPase subunit delta
MAELVTIARPYAVACFAHAKEKGQGQLQAWSGMLDFLVAIYRDPEVQAVLQDPNLTRAGLERTLLAIGGDNLDGAARNLVTLLVRNDRLEALPAIGDLFEQLKADHENEVDARIESAFPLDDAQVRAVVQRLEARTKRKVRAQVEVSPELIGGVRVQIGDDVWDGSVRGQLENLAAVLTR